MAKIKIKTSGNFIPLSEESTENKPIEAEITFAPIIDDEPLTDEERGRYDKIAAELKSDPIIGKLIEEAIVETAAKIAEDSKNVYPAIDHEDENAAEVNSDAPNNPFADGYGEDGEYYGNEDDEDLTEGEGEDERKLNSKDDYADGFKDRQSNEIEPENRESGNSGNNGESTDADIPFPLTGDGDSSESANRPQIIMYMAAAVCYGEGPEDFNIITKRKPDGIVWILDDYREDFKKFSNMIYERLDSKKADIWFPYGFSIDAGLPKAYTKLTGLGYCEPDAEGVYRVWIPPNGVKDLWEDADFSGPVFRCDPQTLETLRMFLWCCADNDLGLVIFPKGELLESETKSFKDWLLRSNPDNEDIPF